MKVRVSLIWCLVFLFFVLGQVGCSSVDSGKVNQKNKLGNQQNMKKVDNLANPKTESDTDLQNPSGLAWNFSTKWSGLSSPVIAGNLLISGSQSYLEYGVPGEVGAVYALDLDTGKTKWEVKVKDSVGVTNPVVSSELVIFGTENGQVRALNLENGKSHWNFRSELKINTNPVIKDNVVYFGNRDYQESGGRGYIYALDIVTGKEKLKLKFGGSVSAPIVGEEAIYFYSADGYLHAIDIGNKKELWKVEVQGNIHNAPVYEKGTVYYGAQDFLYAISSKTGDVKWKFKTFNPTSPYVSKDTVYFSSEKTLWAINSKDGQEKWQTELGGIAAMSPVSSKGFIYVCTLESLEDFGYIYAIDKQSGLEKWKYPISSGVDSDPVVTEGILYFSSNGSLNALSGLNAIRAGSKLTKDYFIPSLESQYIYRVGYGSNEKEERITMSWEAVKDKKYQQKGNFSGGFGNALYEIDQEGIKLIQLESGYYESEGSLDVTQKGDAYEFKFLAPGSKWVNNYQANDFGNISQEHEEYYFLGFEIIKIMGKDMEAAHIILKKDSKVIAETQDNPLSKVSGKTKGHAWYVKGLGLVKTSSESFYGDSNSVFTQELTEIKLK